MQSLATLVSLGCFVADVWELNLLSFNFTYTSWTCLGNGSAASSPGGLRVDGSPIPLGSTATHEPTPIAREVWVRWKYLDATGKNEPMRMSIQGQTERAVRGLGFNDYKMAILKIYNGFLTGYVECYIDLNGKGGS